MAAFELGNELGKEVNASAAAAAFLALDAVVSDVWRGDASRPALVGPDADGSPAARAAYLAAFAAAAEGAWPRSPTTSTSGLPPVTC